MAGHRSGADPAAYPPGAPATPSAPQSREPCSLRRSRRMRSRSASRAGFPSKRTAFTSSMMGISTPYCLARATAAFAE